MACSAAPPDAAPPVELLHLDDDLLVVVKPAGLLAVPGRGEDKQDCLATRVARGWPGALVVHRLDMATSGLMVFARHAQAQRRLGAAFAERRVHKRYLAVVRGCPLPAPGQAVDAEGWSEIDLPLAADWPRRPLQRVDLDAGKPSRTRWRLLAYDAALDRARLALEPVTGRTHQLRVHLQALGHPIVGDALYGPEQAHGAMVTGARLLLHATRLELPHPGNGTRVCVESPVPF